MTSGRARRAKSLRQTERANQYEANSGINGSWNHWQCTRSAQFPCKQPLLCLSEENGLLTHLTPLVCAIECNKQRHGNKGTRGVCMQKGNLLTTTRTKTRLWCKLRSAICAAIQINFIRKFLVVVSATSLLLAERNF